MFDLLATLSLLKESSLASKYDWFGPKADLIAPAKIKTRNSALSRSLISGSARSGKIFTEFWLGLNIFMIWYVLLQSFL